MNYKDEYKRKLVSVEEALARVHSDDEIVCALGPCEPVNFLSQLHTIAHRVEGVTVVNALLMNDYDFFMRPEMAGHFLLVSWFYTPGPRKMHPTGTVTYLPLQLHNFSSKRAGHRKPNIFVGSATPMDKQGNFSLSLSTVMEKDFIELADKVIIEVNPQLPRTYGDTHIHISQIDYLIEADHPVPETIPPIMDEKDHLIGQYIADLIEDGSTLQIGVGSIPGAVAHSLKDKKDLGVHSELFTDCLLDLYEAGAITNRHKSIWKDKFVTDMGMGTRRLYDFLDNNLAVEFLPGQLVNDPAVIGRNTKMVSVNSALQMDLTGQCCAESIGPRQFSGTGGHKEFVTGAQRSSGGKSILAFQSTTRDGKHSHIMPHLDAGAVVTTPRVDVDYVVTEHGVAHLSGCSIRERVTELIRIAHPDFRDYLKSEARRMAIW